MGEWQSELVTDSAEILGRAARAPDLTLRYGPLVDQVIDVRVPPREGWRNDRRMRLVVLIHGGFWRWTYDRQHAGAQSAALADEGYVVATVEYRRVGPGGGGWPETFDDLAEITDRVPGLVSAAVGRPLPEQSAVLVGHSAGGHLALWAAGRHRLPQSSRWHRRSPLPVAGVVSLAGVSDLVRADELRLGADATRALLGGDSRAEPQRYATANPAALLPLGAPTILVHGTDDDVVPVELSRAYARRATAAGDEVELVELEGIGHFELIDPLSGAWPRVLSAVAALM